MDIVGVAVGFGADESFPLLWLTTSEKRQMNVIENINFTNPKLSWDSFSFQKF